MWFLSDFYCKLPPFSLYKCSQPLTNRYLLLYYSRRILPNCFNRTGSCVFLLLQVRGLRSMSSFFIDKKDISPHPFSCRCFSLSIFAWVLWFILRALRSKKAEYKKNDFGTTFVPRLLWAIAREKESFAGSVRNIHKKQIILCM